MGFFHQFLELGDTEQSFGVKAFYGSTGRWSAVILLDLKNHGSEKKNIGKKYHEERLFAGQ